ncbi:MAG: hypothetical protein NVSMB25_02680 [Thermoleophilaceae bacterium]
MSVPEEEPARSPVERTIALSFTDPESGAGKPLSRRNRQTRRTIENYLAAGFVPRFVQRLREIERATSAHERELERAWSRLWLTCAGDVTLFERRWRETADRWSFDAVNALIGEHNAWYPIERRLPLNPRTGDYVGIRGRTYRREELDSSWIFERFPPAAAERALEQDRRAS